MKIWIFSSFFSNFISFIYFKCLIVLAKTSSIILNRKLGSRRPSLLPGFRETALSSFYSKMSGVSLLLLSCWSMFCFLRFSKNFIRKRCWILSKGFSGSNEMVGILSFIYEADSRMKLTWWWWIILWMCFWIWFSSILLRVFLFRLAPLFPKLANSCSSSFFFLSLVFFLFFFYWLFSGFGVKIIMYLWI